MGKEAKISKTRKRWLFYVIIVVVVLFVGFTLYYFIRNNEKYSCQVENGAALHINSGDSIELPVKVIDKNSHTDITVSINNEAGGADNSILTYDATTNMLTANGGAGTAYVVVTSTNEDFQTFTFSVWVGNGSSDNPWFITTAEQFVSIGATGGKFKSEHHYLLENTIDFKNQEIAPIKNFNGLFVGNQNAIKNVKIVSENNNCGLFEVLSNRACIEQLVVENAQITGSYENAGIICAVNEGTIKKCIVLGCLVDVDGATSNVGGVCGLLKRENAGEYAGMRSYVQLCKVQNCNIISENAAGGIAGKCEAGNIINCETTAQTIVGGKFAGGVCGYLASGEDEDYYSVIRYCVTKNAFTETSTNIGGVCGYALTDKTENSNKYIAQFNGNYTTCQTTIGNSNTFAGNNVVASNDLSKKSALSELDFESNWTNENGYIETTLLAFEGKEQVVDLFEFTGSAHTITTKNNLIQVLRNMMNEEGATLKRQSYTINITNDLVLDMASETNWKPIGTTNYPFQGVLKVENGKKVIIKNLTIDCTDFTYGGLFGVVRGQDALISGFVLQDCTLVLNNTTNASGFVGNLQSGFVQNCQVKNLAINGTTRVLGGFTAYNAGNITNCQVSTFEYLATNLTTNFAFGGFCGKNSGNINNCTVIESAITLSTPAGIVAGAICGENSGKLHNCSAYLSSIDATSSTGNFGAIVGINNKEIISCVSSVVALQTNCTGSSRVGGIFGKDAANSITKYSACNEGNITGKEVAGLGGEISGTITECYTSTNLNGNLVCGFAILASGQITNCYTSNTMSAEEKCFGMVSDISKGLVINRCYMGAKINEYNGTSGFLSNFVDRISLISADSAFEMANIFRRKQIVDFDKNVANIATFKYEGVTIQDAFGIGFTKLKNDTLTLEDVKHFVNDLQFNTNVWGLETGKAPILRNCEYSIFDTDGGEHKITQLQAEEY